jgi:hypothetical protein
MRLTLKTEPGLMDVAALDSQRKSIISPNQRFICYVYLSNELPNPALEIMNLDPLL